MSDYEELNLGKHEKAVKEDLQEIFGETQSGLTRSVGLQELDAF